MTPSERASGIRGNLNARSSGVRSRLAARAQRLSEGLTRDLSAIIQPERTQPTLRREEARGGIPSSRGYSQHNYQPGSSTGTGGIAGPLTEEDFSAREYYDPMLSSDGLFAIPQIKKMVLKDADGLEVVVELADPAAPAGGEP